MIYDCFPLFNELDLLEIRLNELDAVVDKFVIVEGTRTHQRKPKPLHYQENKERFAAFAHKIIYVVVDSWPGYFAKFRTPRGFDYDNHQKEWILKGLKSARPDDVVIISDLDEIPRASLVAQYAHTPGIKVFEQRLYYYYLNCLCTHFDTGGAITVTQQTKEGIGWWRGSVMLNYRDIATIKKTRMLRDKENANTTVMYDGGWHFSYLGGIAKVVEKLQSYAHAEHNHITAAEVEQAILNGKSLFNGNTTFALQPVNATLPAFVQQNEEALKGRGLVK